MEKIKSYVALVFSLSQDHTELRVNCCGLRCSWHKRFRWTSRRSESCGFGPSASWCGMCCVLRRLEECAVLQVLLEFQVNNGDIACVPGPRSPGGELSTGDQRLRNTLRPSRGLASRRWARRRVRRRRRPFGGRAGRGFPCCRSRKP